MTESDKDLNLFWGDIHTQFWSCKNYTTGPLANHSGWSDFIEQTIISAYGHIDFLPIVYYPAYDYKLEGGFTTESVGLKDGFLEEWKIIQRLSKKYYKPGEFVTFPAYEWTGGRQRWGDHNVVYLQENSPLDLSMDIDDLFKTLRKHNGIAIPHHTGYIVGCRGKDWSHHDPCISPIAEIFSSHGSSEGINCPFDMRNNGYLSPRVTGGTFQDGLSRGCKFGFIASQDDTGFAGKWSRGLTGIWAKSLTRESIFEALHNRSTYAITGDRIRIQFFANDHFMGEEFKTQSETKFTGSVVSSDEIDRIELIKNGVVLDTYCHNGKWEIPGNGNIRIKLRLEFGWGPTDAFLPDITYKRWKGFVDVRNGKILNVEKCFTMGKQKVNASGKHCEWDLVTAKRGCTASGEGIHQSLTQDEARYLMGQVKNEPALGDSQQSIILELEGTHSSEVSIRSGEIEHKASFDALLSKSTVLPDIEDIKEIIKNKYSLTNFENAENIQYVLAYKTLVHKSVPSSAYSLSFSFTDIPSKGSNYYYIRVSQNNGQMGWSSPIWVQR